MARVKQPKGERGSLKWIQQGVNKRAASLDGLISAKLGGATKIQWLSPLASDDYAEYSDRDFLKKIGHDELSPALAEFWPNRGPQWDALAQYEDGGVLLIEAKAHVGELCSSPTRARPPSRDKIEAALEKSARFMGAKQQAAWSSVFYQLANRIAHLYFLRKHGINAKLVLINFIGDIEMGGPSSEAEWRAAYQVVGYVLGINERHKLSSEIIEIFPDLRLKAWINE